MKAWYFSNETKQLQHGDGRPIELGKTHSINETPELCARGLHGSVKILDALNYAPGLIIWRVELSGKMAIGTDKIAAQHRTYLAGGINIEPILRKFARMCALDVIDLWDAPDVVVQYLKTGNENLSCAAGDATRAAARAAGAAGVAAWAARVAARAARAAGAAASAARDAEVAAGAARVAAGDAAREKQTRRLAAMVSRAIKLRAPS